MDFALISLMEVSPIPDLQVENYLKYARKTLLLSLNSIKQDKVTSVPARHSLSYNEFVFGETLEETQTIVEIEAEIEREINKGNYNFDYRVFVSRVIEDFPNLVKKVEDKTRTKLLFRLHVSDAIEEEKLKLTIPNEKAQDQRNSNGKRAL